MKYRQAEDTNPHGNTIEGWCGGGPNSAFMVPCAEWCDDVDDVPQPELFGDELDEWREEFEPGWYAWLTAPGYLDRTDAIGPYPTFFRAVRQLCRFYEVDLDGNHTGC